MICQYKDGKCVRGPGPYINKDAIYCKQEEPCGSLLSKNDQNIERNTIRRLYRGSENNLIKHYYNGNNPRSPKRAKTSRRNRKRYTRRRR